MRGKIAMNECSVIKPLLALRVEDWSAAERARVETHLEACEACASLRAVYLEQDRLIQNLPPVRLTAAQRGEVWAQTDGEPSAPRGSIFLALNVFSALSTTFVLIVATVNLLLASWTSLVRDDAGQCLSATSVLRAAARAGTSTGAGLHLG
jgi:anti-sigma factor RsiW